jgi:hypothetical protein
MSSINLFDQKTCSAPSSESDPDFRQSTRLTNFTPSDSGYFNLNPYIDIANIRVVINSFNVKATFIIEFLK